MIYFEYNGIECSKVFHPFRYYYCVMLFIVEGLIIIYKYIYKLTE